MNTVLNLIFASFFVLIVSLAVFLPLPLLRVNHSNPSSLVLGATTSAQSVQVKQLSNAEATVLDLSALAYPDQRTYYQRVLGVINNSTAAKKYRLEVVSVSPEDPNLSTLIYFDSTEQSSISILKAGEEKSVDLVFSLGPTGQTLPRSYTVKILVLPLD